MPAPNDFLLLNIGFIVHQTIGFSREFPLEADEVHIPPDLDLVDLSGKAKVTRTAQGLLLQVRLNALVKSECVRCLDEFNQYLETDFTELYAFNRNSVTDSGLILPENGKINLAPIVREEMLLAIPISPLCRPDCRGLCPICGENLNHGFCDHQEESTDARLDILKNLRSENDNPLPG